MRLFCGLTAVAALLAGPAFAAETYTLDGENTTITFVGAKKDGTHAGGFKKLSGKASVDAADPTTLKLEDGLSWEMGGESGRVRTEKEIHMWKVARGAAGRLPPQGFPRDNRF